MAKLGTTEQPLGAVEQRRFSREREFLRRFRGRPSGVISLAVILVVVFFALFGDLASTHDPLETDVQALFEGPSFDHLLGTDGLGRDTYSRIVDGSSTAIQVGLISVLIGLGLGVPIGLIAGYFGGFRDELLMRVMDALYAFPSLLLALVVIAALGPSVNNVMIAISITFVPVFARLVRASTLSVKEQDYVQAAEALGAGSARVILRHILPNVWAPVIVQASLSIGFAIIAEASLSFVGLGAQPPDPSWGSMLQAAQRFLTTHPLLAVFPGGMIVITVLAFNLLGDVMRDLLDPRLRGAD